MFSFSSLFFKNCSPFAFNCFDIKGKYLGQISSPPEVGIDYPKSEKQGRNRAFLLLALKRGKKGYGRGKTLESLAKIFTLS